MQFEDTIAYNMLTLLFKNQEILCFRKYRVAVYGRCMDLHQHRSIYCVMFNYLFPQLCSKMLRYTRLLSEIITETCDL